MQHTHTHSAGCGCSHHRPSALQNPHEARRGGEVTLTGKLVCRDMSEMLTVLDHAQSHIDASRAEAGCLLFELRQTDNPLVFEFAEHFASEEAYLAHQQRTRASAWGAATWGIERQAYDRRGVSQ